MNIEILSNLFRSGKIKKQPPTWVYSDWVDIANKNEYPALSGYYQIYNAYSNELFKSYFYYDFNIWFDELHSKNKMKSANYPGYMFWRGLVHSDNLLDIFPFK